MSEFTKGEWRIEKRFGHSNGERPVITSDNEFVDRIAIVSYHGVKTIKEADANARLIAAAPDLLEACEKVFEESHNPKVERILEAAIAKATHKP